MTMGPVKIQRFLFVVAALCLAHAGARGQSPSFLPLPATASLGEETLVLDRSAVIAFDHRDAPRAVQRSLEPHARVLAAEIELLTGLRPRVVPLAEVGSQPAIELRFVALPGALAASEESEDHGYELEVDGKGVRVSGAYTKGIVHGTATLLQALDAGGASGHSISVPHMRVVDRPLHAYRSVMIDVARQPHRIAVLEDVVRLLRLYKVRYLHLHLTDDQHFTFPFEPVTGGLQNNHAYTPKELRGLVDFAQAHGVTIVPEIDLPGHSSRLLESGYLDGASSHADVAAPASWPKIHRLLDAVMEVFDESPYFHIGGDESQAGEALLPFLGSMQEHVRQRGRRLIVWEGFHGAPTGILPATGPDRVLVASWESSYNAPWDLLNAGYELINAGWQPLYVVGGDSLVHPGSSGGRMWSPQHLAAWHKDEFQHWEPGRPVFEDRGPGDDDRNDGRWLVPAHHRSQVLGAQICVWEQKETSVIRDLRRRVPVVADRLWAGRTPTARDVLERMRAADGRVFAVVQPVGIEPEPRSADPIARLYTPLADGQGVSLVNRTGLAGEIRYTVRPFQGSFTWIDFPVLLDPMADGQFYRDPLDLPGGGAIWARFVLPGGEPYGAGTWARFADWPARVRVTEFPLARRTPEEVPDLAGRESTRSYTLPFLRGPIGNNRIVAQRFDARLRVPDTGVYELSMKTQSGRATLYLDLDGDGTWSSEERLIVNTPPSEALQSAEVALSEETSYALRIDHASGLPRPVLLAFLRGPGMDKAQEVSKHLEILPEQAVLEDR